jgi:hypothetical protein
MAKTTKEQNHKNYVNWKLKHPNYKRKNTTERNAKKRQYRKDNLELVKSIQQKSYLKHKEQRKEYCKTHKKERHITEKKYREKIKFKIFELLGNKCANPYNEHKEPYINFKALQIDHINGGGRKERNKVNGTRFYLDILSEIKLGSKDYQLLCANCNWIKRYENREYGGRPIT